MAVVSDYKKPIDENGDNIVDYYQASLQSATHYYPFGMQSVGYKSNEYRYGFNGMEKDDEIKGEGNSYTTLFRQYDPRIGRWLSLDPLMAKFPWQSPYVAFNNNPIYYRDPTGLEGDPPKVQLKVSKKKFFKRINKDLKRKLKGKSTKFNPFTGEKDQSRNFTRKDLINARDAVRLGFDRNQQVQGFKGNILRNPDVSNIEEEEEVDFRVIFSFQVKNDNQFSKDKSRNRQFVDQVSAQFKSLKSKDVDVKIFILGNNKQAVNGAIAVLLKGGVDRSSIEVKDSFINTGPSGESRIKNFKKDFQLNIGVVVPN